MNSFSVLKELPLRSDSISKISICATSVRMALNWKWEEFAPRIVQSDKRDRENAVPKGWRMVNKNFNELGLSSFTAVPVIDRNRTIEKIVHSYPPKSPLEAFFMDKGNAKFVNGLDKAIEDTQMWALELWDLLDAAENDDIAKKKFQEMVGMEDDADIGEDDVPKVKKTQKPIFLMTSDEIAQFYGGLLKDLYKLEGIEKPDKLWPKIDTKGDVVTKATKLKAYDEKAEEILKRDSYIGRGSGGPNIGNK